MKLKKVICLLYLAAIVLMAAATVVEKYQGTNFVAHHIYGAWWFSLVWALLAATGIAYIVRQHVRRWSVLLLHTALVIILLGALITHLTAENSVMILQTNVPSDTVYVQAENGDAIAKQLPFKVRLNKFTVEHYHGTTAASDYASDITLITNEKSERYIVSMNNICKFKGYRFYQMSYGDNGLTSTLAVARDPVGIPTTYVGYFLLFFSLIWMLFDKRGMFRQQLRLLNDARAAIILLFIACTPLSANAETRSVSDETAKQFGELYILSGDRICPLQTFALDFTKKLSGKRAYQHFSPEQIVTGFVFFGDEWQREPIIKLKRGALRSTLGLDKHIAVNDLFPESVGYLIGPYLQEYYNGNADKFHKQVVDVDEKIALIMELRRGTSLKIFPHTKNGKTTWFAPTDKLPGNMPHDEQMFISNVFNLLYEQALSGNDEGMREIIGKIKKYQVQHAGNSLPTPTQTRAERIYNSTPFATILFMANFACAILLFIALLLHRTSRTWRWFFTALFCLSFAALTACLALRWLISGTIPMSNGYETMLLTAWLVMLACLILKRCTRTSLGMIILLFGFLVSGCFLLVSHINQMNPAITPTMPVLNSPLLSLHVSVIMMAYALLSLTFICAVAALLVKKQRETLTILSKLLLCPAIVTLAIGIFIGAIWANVSWGQYWSWDPKETWALITLMVYTTPLHSASLPRFRSATFYHLYMLAAFLTLIITFFGVNYFLGGMHSYA